MDKVGSFKRTLCILYITRLSGGYISFTRAVLGPLLALVSTFNSFLSKTGVGLFMI
jgi:hypothetical protein